MNYELSLTETEVNTVLGALGELPAKLTMQLIQNIRNQCTKTPPLPPSDKPKKAKK